MARSFCCIRPVPVLCALSCLLAAAQARAQSPPGNDETGAMLTRARLKRTPTFRDRNVARELLADWVDERPDDSALRRAFERIARGAPPAAEQLPALVRIHERYMKARSKAVARAAREAEGGESAPAAPREAASPRARWRYGHVLAVAGIGVLVLAAGVAWVLVAHRRRPA